MPTTNELGRPTESIGDLLNLVSDLPLEPGKPLVADEELQGIRLAILTEAIFLAHKAAHVLGASQVHAEKGMISWSTSSAYYSAFFGMQAILRFLGVAAVDVQSKDYLIDIWPTDKATINIHKATRSFQHREKWGIFQRLLRVADISSVWPSKPVVEIREIGTAEFARPRNRLYYDLHFWPLSDLHNCLVWSPEPNTELLPESDGFPIILAFTVFGLSYRLIHDLATKAPLIADELAIIDNWIKNDFNHTFRNATSTELLSD